MSVKIGVVMDPIAKLNYKKDSTLAMLWAAQDRGWELYYMEQHDLLMDQGVAKANMAALEVFRNSEHWYTSVLRVNVIRVLLELCSMFIVMAMSG